MITRTFMRRLQAAGIGRLGMRANNARIREGGRLIGNRNQGPIDYDAGGNEGDVEYNQEPIGNQELIHYNYEELEQRFNEPIRREVFRQARVQAMLWEYGLDSESIKNAKLTKKLYDYLMIQLSIVDHTSYTLDEATSTGGSGGGPEDPEIPKEVATQLRKLINTEGFYLKLMELIKDQKWNEYEELMNKFVENEKNLSGKGLEYSRLMRASLHEALIKKIEAGTTTQELHQYYIDIHPHLFEAAGACTINPYHSFKISQAGFNALKANLAAFANAVITDLEILGGEGNLKADAKKIVENIKASDIAGPIKKQ